MHVPTSYGPGLAFVALHCICMQAILLRWVQGVAALPQSSSCMHACINGASVHFDIFCDPACQAVTPSSHELHRCCCQAFGQWARFSLLSLYEATLTALPYVPPATLCTLLSQGRRCVSLSCTICCGGIPPAWSCWIDRLLSQHPPNQHLLQTPSRMLRRIQRWLMRWTAACGRCRL